MAIPQPGFVGPSKNEYQLATQAGFGNAARGYAQAAQTRANLDLNRQRLEEDKRQFNVDNMLDFAYKVAANQYGNDIAAFLRGPRDPNNPDQFLGNPVAESMFSSLYGDAKGKEMYRKAVATMGQTAGQMNREVMRDFLISGYNEPSQGEGQQGGGGAQATPASYEQNTGQTATRRLDSSVPQTGGTQQQQQQPGYFPSPNVNAQPSTQMVTLGGGMTTMQDGKRVTTPGQQFEPKRAAEILSMQLQNAYDNGNYEEADASMETVVNNNPLLAERYGNVLRNARTPQLRYAVYNDMIDYMRNGMEAQDGKQAQAVRQAAQQQVKDYNTTVQQQQQQQQQQGPLTNSAGLPAAEGQQNVSFPINTDTLNLFNDVKVPDGADAGTIASSIADQVKANGGSEEAADFLSKGTKYLRSGDEKDWEEYDKKAKEYFGVDGETLFSIRNQMFDNIYKGRPVGYMPPENERTQWWWTGKDMPIADRLRNASIIEKPTVVDMATALDGVSSRIDLYNAGPEDLMKISDFITTSQNTTTREVASDDTKAEDMAKKIGLPQNRKELQTYLEAVGDARGLDDFNRFTLRFPKAARVGERLTGSFTAKAKKAAAGVISGKNKEKKAKEAGTRLEEEKSLRLVDGIALSRARAEQIYKEMSGREPMSKEVELSIPLAERRFSEAKRQFNANLALQYAQMPSGKEKDMLNKMKAADLAMKEMELEMAEQQFKAWKEGDMQQAPDYSAAYEISKGIHDKITDSLVEQAKGDPKLYQTLYTKTLEEVPSFKNAEEMLNYIASATSGVPLDKVKEESKKGRLAGTNFLQSIFGRKVGGATTETYRATPPFSVSPTVTSNDAEQGGNAGNEYAKQLGY